MSSVIKQGAGMSKAAQRKRKSLNKSLHVAAIAGLSQSDDEENDVSPKKSKKSHQNRTPDGNNDAFNQYEDKFESVDLSEVSLTNILDMKEVVDVTSKERASLLLRRLISPTSLSEFYGSMWEKRPLYVEHSKKYFADMINSSEVEDLLANHLLLEGEDIAFSDERGLLDVNGQPKDEEDVDGGDDESEQNKDEVNYEMIKTKLARSQTVNFLTPQKYHDGTWRLLSALEHEFECMVGANVVMAPPNSTSNPRQYDSSDNFILQLKGNSEWSLWAPAKGQELPRTPGSASSAGSGDDGEPAEEKKEEKPSYTHTLSAGDTLYIPKGWHYMQRNTDPKVRSLTCKLFTNQGHAAADLLDVLLPQALHEAAQSHLAFRKCLPRDLRSFLGVIVSEDESVAGKREAFQGQIKKLLESLVETAVDVLDPAADQLTKKMLAERLPVCLSSEEEQCTASGLPNVEIHDYTKLRMVRPGVASVFVEDGKCVVYHCMHNSRELFGNPLQPLEFELDDGPTLEGLLRAYPEGVTVSELDHPSEELEDKIGVAQALFKEGFLLIDDEFTKSVLGINSGGGEKNNDGGDNDDEDSIF